ncbi:MAG: hypothetical protein E6H70_14515 [Betaproteobacteria bacterium]|nr:MAG: hypothetical protein E6H70_14515 [Betaproteobacteria bacterium]
MRLAVRVDSRQVGEVRIVPDAVHCKFTARGVRRVAFHADTVSSAAIVSSAGGHAGIVRGTVVARDRENGSRVDVVGNELPGHAPRVVEREKKIRHDVIAACRGERQLGNRDLGKRRLRRQIGGESVGEEALDQNEVVAFHGFAPSQASAL